VTNKPCKRFIGIDLGGGKGKKTALAVLDRSKSGVTVTALHPVQASLRSTMPR